MSIAPGVSAPQICGPGSKQIMPILDLLFASEKLISLHIVELSPPHDFNEITAKLAANLIVSCFRKIIFK